jgi:hypothetical protein
MLLPMDRKNILPAVIYFLLSTIITWWFVAVCPLYTSLQQQLLSTGIAGTKWALQIIAGYLFLAGKKWLFIKNIGSTCLLGSVILLPYAILATYGQYSATPFFIGSLLIAVFVMIISYFINVKRSGISFTWFWGWIICLAIAITLQLSIVFDILQF